MKERVVAERVLDSGAGFDSELNEFGYTNRLKRSLGGFHTFAAGISYISILTGTFQLFYFGYSFGGPAYWWSWPLVFVGQLMVALSFAELAAHYPVAGSVYNWTKKLSNPHLAWLTGWMMLIASIVSISATALAYQHTLPQIWSGFQVIGSGTGTSDAANGVLLAAVLIAFTTIVNAIGVKLMARINSAGVFIELVAAIALAVLLAFHAVRGPSVVLDTQQHGSSSPGGYLGMFLIAAIASTYVMYGFDTAASLGEETLDPRKNAPKAILRALIASFVIGGAILLFGLMAARNLGAGELSSVGLQFVLTDVLGGAVGRVFLICVFVAITVCVLAVHTAAIRMVFAMARDNALPGGSVLAKVHPRYQTPVITSVVIGVLALLLLVANIGSTQIFTAITSLAVILIYLAYLLVTVPMLAARLRGRWPLRGADGRPIASGRFSLGRWGLPVNILGIIWGAGMTVNLAWPRREVYNATPPYHWYLQWISVLFVVIVGGGGFAYYWFVQRHKTGVLADHAYTADSGTPANTADSGEVREGTA